MRIYVVCIQVDVSFIEIEAPKETSEVAFHGDEMVKGIQQEEGLDSSDGCVTEDPCSSSDFDMDVSRLLLVADNEEKTISSKSRRKSSSSHSSSGDSNPDLQLLSVSKHRFFPWGSKSRTKKKSEEKADKETQPSSSPVNSLSNNILVCIILAWLLNSYNSYSVVKIEVIYFSFVAEHRSSRINCRKR